MAKKTPVVSANDDSPYVNEAPAAKKSVKQLLSSRGAKIGAVVAGSTLALGAAFGIGLTAGHAQGPAFGPDQMGQGQFGDHDGDRGMGRPGHGPDGHRDGGQFNPNGQMQPLDPNAPAPTAPTAPPTPGTQNN